jgi:FlaA1/EpsC-like NDP-sugar epimerase
VQKRLLAFPRRLKQLLAIALDIISALLTVWLAFSLRLDEMHIPTGMQWLVYLLAPLLMLPLFVRFGLYRAVYRYSGIDALFTVFKASVFYGLSFFLTLFLLHLDGVPRSVGILQPMMLFLISGGSRSVIRFWFSGVAYGKNKLSCGDKMLIYGAGEAGIQIAVSIQRSPRFCFVGFIDDDRGLQGRTIIGMPVYSPDVAEELIMAGQITGMLLALPSATRSRRNQIVERFRKYHLHIKTLPGVEAFADGRVTISDIKEVEIEDLLGRDSLPMDLDLVEKNLKGRIILVTGAGGSIGSELCRQLLAAEPSKLILVDHAEYNLYAIHSNLHNRITKSGLSTELIPLLGDVTDERRITEIFRTHSPQVIYHAAAYKHVPMVEANPAEGVRNNVVGTLVIAQSALHYGVECMILVSTDKAVRPTNVMGASKRICELILQALAAEPGHNTRFSMVRFGNVLGSSGSVVPLFRRQIQDGGPVTVTHEEVTRYFMSIPEAAQLVIQAGAMAEGGEVFLLDMGEPVKIMDLARRMVELSGLTICESANPHGDISIVVNGLRPGEKLYEELLIGEQEKPTANPRIFMANEHYLSWRDLHVLLEQMHEAIEEDDREELMKLLWQIVPEYLNEWQMSAISVDEMMLHREA